eukprot:364479-Chlamydomonas_euryale.AAC.14
MAGSAEAGGTPVASSPPEPRLAALVNGVSSGTAAAMLTAAVAAVAAAVPCSPPPPPPALCISCSSGWCTSWPAATAGTRASCAVAATPPPSVGIGPAEPGRYSDDGVPSGCGPALAGRPSAASAIGPMLRFMSSGCGE